MDTSRTDEILEGWKMASHSAQRPASPPASNRSRAALAASVLAVFAVVILALVVGSRMLASGPGPALPAVGASAPAATATVVPTPVASRSAPSEPSASTTTLGGPQVPSPADIAAARAFVDTYTAKLKGGDTQGAWTMLSRQERSAKYTSEAQWAVERYQFFQSVKGYTVTANPTDVLPIANWLDNLAINRGAVDLGHAVLVKVTYAGVPGPADWDLYVVNRTADGGLEIYSVR
jgi:hypothetical protein